jgi:AmpD protein
VHAERIDSDGWWPGARKVRSPNFDERPPGCSIDLLVMHNISLPPGRFGTADVEHLFTNTLDCGAHPFFALLTGARVSAHFYVGRDGRCTQFVSCLHRAWHAGSSCWRGRARVNDFSVGVELEGTDFLPFTAAQYACLQQLGRALRETYGIAAACGHADIAPGRKTDPGPFFDWAAFQEATGLSERT